jgi:hypothetical protein
MAVFNEILVGRYNRFVQKHFAMKGRANLPTLSADLQMGVNFNNGAENRYLEAWDLFGVQAFMAAIAAQPGQLELRNPASSGVIAVVTRAAWVESIATVPTGAVLTTLQLTRGATTDQNTARVAVGWDQRSRPASTLLASFNSAAPAAVGGTTTGIGFGANVANVGIELIPPGQEIPLSPGSALSIVSGNVNTASAGVLWWRERFLEESERT